MSSQPPNKRPARPALAPTSPTSSVSRRTTLRGLGGLSAALLLGATSRVAGAHSAQTDALSKSVEAPVSVVGAWDLSFRASETATGTKLDRFLATFGAEGGFQAGLAPAWITSAGSLRFHGGGHGTWTTDDDGVVEARYTALIYDEFGAYDGARVVSIRAILASDIFLSGEYASSRYDAGGTLVDLVSGAVAGTVAGNPATGSRGNPSVTLPSSWVVSPQPGQPGWPF